MTPHRCQPSFAYSRFSVAARRVEHQQRLAAFERAAFGAGEQRGTDTAPARAPMHQHLRKIRAMRLILRLGENELHRADDDSGRVLSRQHHAFASRRTPEHGAPELLGFVTRHRQHEAHRRAAFHAVDQHVAQGLEFALADCFQTADPDRFAHSEGSAGGRMVFHTAMSQAL